MKRTLALLIVLLLLATCMPSLAEDASTQHFVVGAPTAMNGSFFTGMWGNNTSDIDVRTLLHAYSPVVWTMQSLFEPNPTVVQSIDVGLIEGGNKMYTITLQQDLKYNDGTPITAEDYVFSLLLHASPVIKELGGNTTSVSYIAGYEPYANGESQTFSGVGLINTYTFTIEISQEFLPFFYELGMLDVTPYPIAAIAPGCAVDDDGAGTFITNQDPSATTPLFTAALLQETILNETTGYLSHPKVTSGPYQLDSYDYAAKTATFSINTNFKGDHMGQKPTIPYLKYINVIPETMISELENGTVDLINKVVAGENIDEGLALMSENLAASTSYPRMGFGFIAFTCEKGPAQFQSVRQAIAYSLDVEEFCRQYTTLNYGLPVYGYYGVGQWMVQMVLSPGTRPEATDAAETTAWEALSLAGLNTYAPDAELAKKVLTDDGWTLNSEGNDFTEGTDTVRYKQVDGSLMELKLVFGKTEDSIAANILVEMLTEPLAALGINLEVKDVGFQDLLINYYRQQEGGEREFDMMHLATNFLSIFDPYFTYNTDEDFIGSQNTSGLIDEEMERLALDLRQTEAGDMLTYIQKWLVFQEYWNGVLPMVPLYSNVYFDFFRPDLQEYARNMQESWASAILYAYLGDAPAVTAGGAEATDVTTIDGN